MNVRFGEREGRPEVTGRPTGNCVGQPWPTRLDYGGDSDIACVNGEKYSMLATDARGLAREIRLMTESH